MAGARTIGLLSRSSDLLAAVELDGLRAYRPGTPASRIHWPALAKGAGLLERKLRVAGDTVPLVVLDARGPEPLGQHGDHLDAAVRAAASLTLELARARGCRLLLPGEQAGARDLDRPARVAGRPRPPGSAGGRPGHARAVARCDSECAGPALLRHRRACRAASANLRPGHGRPVVVVLPAPLASRGLGGVAFTVAGCVGLLVGARSSGDGAVAARRHDAASRGEGSRRREHVGPRGGRGPRAYGRGRGGVALAAATTVSSERPVVRLVTFAALVLYGALTVVHAHQPGSRVAPRGHGRAFGRHRRSGRDRPACARQPSVVRRLASGQLDGAWPVAARAGRAACPVASVRRSRSPGSPSPGCITRA